MARFTLQIDCDNAAFQDDDPYYEVGRILAKLGADLMSHDENDDDGNLCDVNGNTVGQFWYRR